MRYAPAPAVPDRPRPLDVADDLAEPLAAPAAWTAPARPPLPIVAAVVPVVGAVGLWLVTGSILSLWLAALGPLIAAATVADAARSARRDRRRHEASAAQALDGLARTVSQRHDVERRRAWSRHPDVAGFVLNDDDVWRHSPERADALVAGSGDVASVVRLTGGEGDAAATALRGRASLLERAPVVVPASRGIVVVGPAALAAAVQRALVLQLCLALAPGELAVQAPPADEFTWVRRLPHAIAPSARVLTVVPPGEPVPADADLAVARCLPGEPLPPRCATVLSVASPDAGRLHYAGEEASVRIEAIAHDQAESIAAALAVRAEQALGIVPRDTGPIALASLMDAAPPQSPGALPAVIGADGPDPVLVDLVADGPHAVVAGVTGSGKSELLITWILALCRTHSPREVVFLLADFKGGTAFDVLAAVPHVTGVITDLDGSGARRAIESLRAEIRAREAAIAGAGARDILDDRVSLPRLVVVVDEFAALLGEHPELHAVFADVAARGRALGIHLVIGTQRAAGVIRESLLTSCPLRISLRVTDPADSRTVLGTDDAALLPGGPEGRGHAYVRRGGDSRPRRVRIALADESDVAQASTHLSDGPIRRPWLPELPERLELDELRARFGLGPGLLVGLADEPDRQRQTVVVLQPADRAVLVIGGPGSGASSTLELVAGQAGRSAIRVPGDPEGAWDCVEALAAQPPAPDSVVCIDDLDSLTARLPPDHAQAVVERLDALIRGAGPGGYLVVAAAHRIAGPVSRLIDLFPRRLRLPFPTRAEHLAAGGDARLFQGRAPAGRGEFDGVSVQVAAAPLAAAPPPQRPVGEWRPTSHLTGFVTRRSPAARVALDEWEGRGIRSVSLDAYVTDPSLAAGPLVLFGEPDDWQRHWRLLADVRGDHDLVVDTSCAAELRLLTGTRALAPYCEPGLGRAWLVAAGADPVRIVLPSGQIRPLRRLRHLDRPDAAP